MQTTNTTQICVAVLVRIACTKIGPYRAPQVSSEWWKGKLASGDAEGLFPASYVAVEARAGGDDAAPIELKVKIAVKGKKFVGELKFEGGATVAAAVRKVAKIAALPDEDSYAFFHVGGATFLQPSKTLRACGLNDKVSVVFSCLLLCDCVCNYILPIY